MSSTVPMTRQAQRRADTRARISDSATRLFWERGYEATSLADIAAAADVAVRTIYLHFDSKAAIALDYFDRWLDDFVELVLERPVDEPLADTIAFALEGVSEAGWDDRPAAAGGHLHPTIAASSGHQPELAGYMLQRWVAAIGRISETLRANAGDSLPPDSVAPEARAAAIMATWFGAMQVFRAAAAGDHAAAHGRTKFEVAAAVARALGEG